MKTVLLALAATFSFAAMAELKEARVCNLGEDSSPRSCVTVRYNERSAEKMAGEAPQGSCNSEVSYCAPTVTGVPQWLRDLQENMKGLGTPSQDDPHYNGDGAN